MWGQSDLVELINDRNDSLRSAINNDNINVPIPDGPGWTPLHYICSDYNKTDDPTMLKWLVDHGANMHAMSDHGNTPLHIALCGLKYNCARTLLNCGANVNAVNYSNHTPIERTYREYGQSLPDNIIMLLLDYGATIIDFSWFPQNVHNVVKLRNLARDAALIVLGIHRYHRSLLISINNKDIARLIARMVWDSRYTQFTIFDVREKNNEQDIDNDFDWHETTLQ